jgi:hypothetical protein
MVQSMSVDTMRVRALKSKTKIGGGIGLGSMPFPVLFWMLYMSTLAFEGPLRGLLSVVKLENALYLRDLFAIVVVIAATRSSTTWGGRKFDNGIVPFVVYLILCHAVAGMWLGNPLVSVLFALKIFVAFVFGMAVAPHLADYEEVIFKFLAWVFVLSSIGVYVNNFVGDFPWEKMDYETAFGVGKISKIWWAGGERRLSGFARVSYTAASVIGVSGAFVASSTRHTWVKLGVFFVGLPAIYLTTSKGVIISYLLVSVWSLVAEDSLRRKFGSVLAYFFGMVAILFPLLAAYFDSNPDAMRFAPSVVGSFVERFTLTWPDAFSIYSEWYNFAFGQGVGGVAGALRFSERAYQFNPCDNMALYFYMNFGVLGVLYFVYVVNKTANVVERSSESSFAFGLQGAGLMILGYGITAQIVEDPAEMMLLGVAVTYGSLKPILSSSVQQFQRVGQRL